MLDKNMVQINIVELETLKKIAALYKKDNPGWEEKIYGKKVKKIETAKTKVEEKSKD